MDYVLAGAGRFHEPARRKKAYPGGHLRLPRFTGDRIGAHRRSGRASVRMRQRGGRLICDEVVRNGQWMALTTRAGELITTPA